MPISTCTECGEIFYPVRAFDKHRVGPYYPVPKRRCLTTDEMIDRGFDINKHDQWVAEAMPPEEKARRKQLDNKDHGEDEEEQEETEQQWDETLSNPRVMQHLQQMADEALDEIAQLSQDLNLYEKERA